MKYAILGLRSNIMVVFDQPPTQPYIEITDEQAKKVFDFKEQKRLALLIDENVTNFKEQLLFGNSLGWDASEKRWIITPRITGDLDSQS